MPSDALTYSFIAKELNHILCSTRIEKIYMPFSDDIILKCKNGKESRYLLISALPSAPRVHLTSVCGENPINAPSFLMHLRKHIQGGTIENIQSIPFERVLIFSISIREEFIIKKYKLIAEITGKYSNIILVGEDNKISDAIKHITPDISSKRLIMPGIVYQNVPQQNKLLPTDPKLIELISSYDGERPDKFILSVMSGLAPSSITEAVVRATGGIGKLKAGDAEKIVDSILNMHDDLHPCLIKSESQYLDFTPSPFVTAKGQNLSMDSMNQCLEIFFGACISYSDLSERSKRLQSILKNAEKRTLKKLDELHIQKTECMDCENERIKGELLTANLYQIRSGANAVKVLNYYTGNEMEIPLDPTKSPADNAQSYFKKYSKKKNGLIALDKQIEDAKSLLSKIENAYNSFELCSSRADLDDIEAEIFAMKLLRNKEIKNRKNKPSEPLSLEINGFKIEVGKNNIQNDRLWRNAKGKDIWLHTRLVHGSHVIIKCADSFPPNEILLTAASLAAYYSRSRMADKVEVDYTYAKYVKSIPGGGPGKVFYTNQKTLFVQPAPIESFK